MLDQRASSIPNLGLAWPRFISKTWRIDRLAAHKRRRPWREAAGRVVPLPWRAGDPFGRLIAGQIANPRHLAGRRSMVDLGHVSRRGA
jgi:hypothetical protein